MLDSAKQSWAVDFDSSTPVWMVKAVSYSSILRDFKYLVNRVRSSRFFVSSTTIATVKSLLFATYWSISWWLLLRKSEGASCVPFLYRNLLLDHSAQIWDALLCRVEVLLLNRHAVSLLLNAFQYRGRMQRALVLNFYWEARSKSWLEPLNLYSKIRVVVALGIGTKVTLVWWFTKMRTSPYNCSLLSESLVDLNRSGVTRTYHF